MSIEKSKVNRGEEMRRVHEIEKNVISCKCYSGMYSAASCMRPLLIIFYEMHPQGDEETRHVHELEKFRHSVQKKQGSSRSQSPGEFLEQPASPSAIKK